MALIDITVNGRRYEVACGDGQEAHLRRLASLVNERVTTLAKDNGPIDESRLLVIASILLADELLVEQAALGETRRQLEDAQNAIEKSAEDSGSAMEQASHYIADIFDDVSRRLESVADALEDQK